MIWFLLACMHTPPHPKVDGAPTVQLLRREYTDPDGKYCSWEAESLYFGGNPLWTEEPPDAPNGCVPPGEQSRIVDVIGQDGPYVSVILREWGCCPETAQVRCVTFDGTTGQPATLVQYDKKHAERRLLRAQKVWEKMGAPEGYTLSPDSFLVNHGHISFCAIRGEEVRRLEVR